MKTEQIILQENIDELVKLQKENPNARVLCMVAWEDIANDDYCRVAAEFNKPTLNDITWINDIIHERVDIDEDIETILLNSDVLNPASECGYIDEKIEEYKQTLKWETVIIVNIGS